MTISDADLALAAISREAGRVSHLGKVECVIDFDLSQHEEVILRQLIITATQQTHTVNFCFAKRVFSLEKP